ncbi:MAG: deoxynucleoside kinase [Calditrichota bacterium]
MSKSILIGIAGNIGVGKTTLTEKLGKRLNLKTYYESVIDNPYLDEFYGDMSRWSFNLQIYFLAHRFKSQKQISESGINAVQDRTIYEDVEIFARSLYEQEYMSEKDYECYSDLFHNMIPFLKKPDVIIYLNASVDTLMGRIQQRGRDFETTIERSYIEYLNGSYERWMKRARNDFKVLEIDANKTDFINGDDDLEWVAQKLEEMVF